jgi:hypothetical protein
MSQYSGILQNCGSRFVVQVTCASGALRKLSGEQDTSPHTSHPTPHTSHPTPHTSHLTPHSSYLTLFCSWKLFQSRNFCENVHSCRFSSSIAACFVMTLTTLNVKLRLIDIFLRKTATISWCILCLAGDV